MAKEFRSGVFQAGRVVWSAQQRGGIGIPIEIKSVAATAGKHWTPCQIHIILAFPNVNCFDSAIVRDSSPAIFVMFFSNTK